MASEVPRTAPSFRYGLCSGRKTALAESCRGHPGRKVGDPPMCTAPLLQISDPADQSWYVPLHQVGGKPAEATSPHMRLPAHLDDRAIWSGPTLPKLPPCRWCLKVAASRGAWGASGLSRTSWLPRRQGGGLLGRGCSSAAGARPPSPPCMPMRRTWGAAGAVHGKRDTASAVASQVAGRSGRAGLPRPPSPPGSRLHF